MNYEEKYNKDRILTIGGEEYYFDTWKKDGKCHCGECDLEDICDEMADTLNHIEWGLCSTLDDKEFLKKAKGGYFKKIKN